MQNVILSPIAIPDLINQIANELESRFYNNQPPKKELPKYLNPVQLSELVSWKLTTVYQNHHNGLIPGAKKVGNRLLFDTAIILKWIEEKSIPTKAEKIEAIENRVRRK
ncbi:MAG: hypothetical protein AB9834_23855 [Lentimicrobium sp.]